MDGCNKGFIELEERLTPCENDIAPIWSGTPGPESGLGEPGRASKNVAANPVGIL